MIMPIGTVRIAVQNRLAWGSAKVKGNTPRIENQITNLRPKRSPTGPPIKAPAATAPENKNR